LNNIQRKLNNILGIIVDNPNMYVNDLNDNWLYLQLRSEDLHGFITTHNKTIFSNYFPHLVGKGELFPSIMNYNDCVEWLKILIRYAGLIEYT
jgi:hypothetical protein